VALPSALSVPSEHFVCLLSWNAQRVPVETISAVAERLLGLGCVYFCCRGRDCERVHDVIDEVLVGDGNANVAWLDVMTTWHDNEALEDTIDFFLESACPTDRYLSKCTSAVALTIGSEYEVTCIELAVVTKLRQPRCRWAMRDSGAESFRCKPYAYYSNALIKGLVYAVALYSGCCFSQIFN
jgi:hypothetical protein